MKTKSWILSLSCLLFVTVIGHSQFQLPDSTVKELRTAVEGFKNRYRTPAMVVAIVHDQDIIFEDSKGYIDLGNKIPASLDAKFPILSVTKVFTAIMLMQLRNKKLLTLDDDVRKYIPEYPGESSTNGNNGITLLQLATHTSGLPRNSPADIDFTKQIDLWLLGGASYKSLEPATNKELLRSLRYIKKEYPDYELLSCNDRHYSNLGYSILGIALERASKTNYESYVINNICKPLQMHNSGFGSKNLPTKGYYYDDSLKNFVQTPTFNANGAIYAGGMYATAGDLAKFTSFQFDNSSAKANQVLNVKDKAMMASFRIGWKSSYPFVVHEGAMLGYRCEIVYNPSIKLGWVILTNTTEFDFSRINDHFSKLLLPVFRKQTSPDLQQYAGDYYLAGGYDSLTIYMKESKLYSSYLQSTLPATPLAPSGNHQFKAQGKGGYSISYEFIPDEANKIRILNMGQLMWTKKDE